MKDNLKDFDSPTTPGLKINFSHYVIELVCLNTNYKIVPRFWKDNIYWSKKYVREIKGVHNLLELFKNYNLNIDSPSLQKSLIEVIKKYNIKSLSAKKTIESVLQRTIKTMNEKQVKVNDYKEDNKFDIKDNSRYVDFKKKNKKSLIKEIEDNG